MSRYFAPITSDELEEKINKAFVGADSDCTNKRDRFSTSLMFDKLGKDLKVKFDFENFEMCGNSPILGKGQLASSQIHLWLGYHTLPNGLTFLGCYAGGDWETPVSFIIYWDGKKLRGYVPLEGNPWNTTTKEAYGNDEDADGINAHKRWPDDYDGSPVCDNFPDPDDNEMLKDISTRILPVPSGLKINAKAVLVANIGKLRKTLENKVKALEYYGDCDESTELFEQTLCLCYTMSGVGEDDHAETLYEWAKEQCKASKEYAEEYAEENGETNIIKGVWGH